MVCTDLSLWNLRIIMVYNHIIEKLWSFEWFRTKIVALRFTVCMKTDNIKWQIYGTELFCTDCFLENFTGLREVLRSLQRKKASLLMPQRWAFKDCIKKDQPIVAEWLKSLMFSSFNHLSSHHCGFEPSSGHMWDKPSSTCGWSVVFSLGLPFSLRLIWLKMS